VSWRNNLRTPSFRGVEFFVSGTEREGGRSLAIHEFPGRDTPYAEDISRAPRAYPIEAFYTGSDYMTRRDALIKALEQPGPGDLVHPYYGTVKVCVRSFRVRETAEAGNFVGFSIEFVEAGSLAYPSVDALRGGLLSSVKAGVTSRSLSSFLRQYDITRYPSFVADAVRTKVTQLSTAIEDSTSGVVETGDKITDLAISAADLRSDMEDLIDNPDLLADRMASAIGLISGSMPASSDQFRAYTSLFTYGADDVITSVLTASRVQENTNNKAFREYVKSLAVASAAEAAAAIEFESEEDAQAAKDTMFDCIEGLYETIEDDDLLFALADLRTFISKNVPDPDTDLPHVIDVDTTESVPAVVLSYELFGDVLSEDDILARNFVVDPNRVPGGQTLRVVGRV